MAQQEQDKLRKRLEALLKLPDNQFCADCRKRAPRWASANLGIFMCIECSGIHRNLGVHISFVRSVNLDTWTKAQVDFMEEWGNGRANEYWEANVPSHVIRPKEGDPVRVVEKFIREKYEMKKFVGSSIPEKKKVDLPVEEESSKSRRTSAVVRTRPAFTSANSDKNNSSSTVTASVSAKKEAPKNEPSLLDFMDDPVPSPAPAQVFAAAPVAAAPPIPQSQPAQAVANNDFFSFTAAAPATPASFDQTPSPDGFGNFAQSFGAAPVPQAQPPSQFPSQSFAPTTAPPSKPQVSTDAILSLYGQPSSQPRPMMPGYGMPGQQPQMGGMPGYPAPQLPGQMNAYPPQPPMQQGFPGMYPHQQPMQPGMHPYGMNQSAPRGPPPIPGMPPSMPGMSPQTGFPTSSNPHDVLALQQQHPAGYHPHQSQQHYMHQQQQRQYQQQAAIPHHQFHPNPNVGFGQR